jgi:hypothetical protein
MLTYKCLLAAVVIGYDEDEEDSPNFPLTIRLIPQAAPLMNDGDTPSSATLLWW